MDVQWESLAELREELRVEMRDVTAAKRKFTDEELELSLIQGLRLMTPFVFTQQEYSVTMNSSTYEVTLPDYVHRVVPPVRAIRTGSTGDYTDMLYFEQLKVDGNHIFRYRKPHGSLDFLVTYERRLATVPGRMSLGVDLTDSAEGLTLKAADSYFSHRLEPYSYIKIDNEIIKVVTIADEVLSELVRAQRGTVAAAHAVGAEVSAVIEVPDARYFNWILDYAAGRLNRIRLQSVTSADLAGNVTAMRDYDQAAERALKRLLPAVRRRHTIFERPRRYTKR